MCETKWLIVPVFFLGCIVTVLIGLAAMLLTKKASAEPQGMRQESVEYGDSFTAVNLMDLQRAGMQFSRKRE